MTTSPEFAHQRQLVDESNNPIDFTALGVAIPSSLVHGQQTVAAAGTAEALAASTPLTSGVTIKALAGNTGVVYVGDSDVDSSNGFELAAGEQVFVEIDDLASVFVDAATNDDGVSFIGS